ncbi:PIN domain-containing protein [Leptospira sp. FAT2]|uniref:PIN domain-containing protein n=1 Tax=Leptospira sanjuanensis TaxID=2879643 RepID=UPI001EE91EFC|nr:PIN domain-containing protein [Leptospira sanjuanensis]MCG6170095.1 PIN domain-containing protein [Leptospira sanjuanensis]MCG6195434.1 PIN domain-containing protein [Leptospira sanjuanensis]
MIVYIDSSVLLSIIFQEPTLDKSISIWKATELRVSSILLEAECKISIKRAYFHNKKKLGTGWKERKLTELDKLLEEINLKNLDSSTMENLNNEDLLSGCRTLDALHLSTAIEFRNELGEELLIFSYDKDFNKIAQELSFKTL